ncbi:MAG: hypothetical protein R2941_18390 [Desulfobacterales bacterium]
MRLADLKETLKNAVIGEDRKNGWVPMPFPLSAFWSEQQHMAKNGGKLRQIVTD